MITRRLIIALALAAGIAANPGPALALADGPIYNTHYYSDATYTVEVGFDLGNCTVYGPGYAYHSGQATPYIQYELTGYCINGEWQPF